MRAMLTSERAKLTAERWVLGDEGDVDADIEKLRELYFERYKNAWRDFLLDLQTSAQRLGNILVLQEITDHFLGSRIITICF